MVRATASRSAAAKRSMKCGEVGSSTKPGKKVMKLYCIDGHKKLVHAGAKGYGNNYSAAARRNYRARHHCASAKPGTAEHLACTELWKGPSGRTTQPTKAHPGKSKKSKA